jgi:hypothetical protein
MSGRTNKLGLYISTPTVDDVGIDALFKGSTQEFFYFKCPHCGKREILEWPDSIVITGEISTDPNLADSHLICRKCKKTLPHKGKHEWLSTGVWVARYKDRASRGFHVNQLYSPTVSPPEIARAFLKSTINEADKQEFFNSKIGICYTAPDARLTDSDISRVIGTYTMIRHSRDKFVTMGVDVGADLHYQVTQWSFSGNTPTADVNLMAKAHAVEIGKVKEFEELDFIMNRHQVSFCVVDRHPETRKAREFCFRFPNRTAMCVYVKGISSKEIHHDRMENTVKVDRTSWMDLALGRVRAGKITLPVDVPFDYKDHLKAPVRCYSRDSTGNPVAQYVTGENAADHYGHALVYAEIALPMACCNARNQSISEVF